MRLLAGAPLLLIYLLAVNSWTAWDFALGIALASTALHRFQEFVLPHPGPLRGRLGSTLRGFARLCLNLLVGFGGGTRVVLRAMLSKGGRPGFVEVSLPPNVAPEAAELAAFLSTLSPDLFLADMEEEGRSLVFHAMDASDPAAIRRRHHDLLERCVAPFLEALEGAETKQTRAD